MQLSTVALLLVSLAVANAVQYTPDLQDCLYRKFAKKACDDQANIKQMVADCPGICPDAEAALKAAAADNADAAGEEDEAEPEKINCKYRRVLLEWCDNWKTRVYMDGKCPGECDGTAEGESEGGAGGAGGLPGLDGIPGAGNLPDLAGLQSKLSELGGLANQFGR